MCASSFLIVCDVVTESTYNVTAQNAKNAVRDNSLNFGAKRSPIVWKWFIHSFMQKETPINLKKEKKCLVFKGISNRTRHKQITTRAYREHAIIVVIIISIISTLWNLKYIFYTRLLLHSHTNNKLTASMTRLEEKAG